MAKKIGIRITIFFFITLLFTGCGKSIKGPAIKFQKLIHNFGEVNEGEEVPYAFIFTNPGSETLIIEDVRPACGCTVPGEYDREVEPGKRGGIPIVFDTTGFEGKTAKTIVVQTNVPGHKSYTLTIEGTVNVQVAVNPRILVMGKVDDETGPVSNSVTMTNNTNSPMEILEIIPPNDRTEVELSVIEQDKEYKLDVTVKPPYKDGHVVETIIVKTNLAVVPMIDVKYSYFLPPMLDVKPTEVYIDPNKIAGEAVREIYVYTSLGISLEITNINLTSKNIDYTIEETNPGELYKIVLHFKPGFRFPSDAPIFITFQIPNAPESPIYTVPIINASRM